MSASFDDAPAVRLSVESIAGASAADGSWRPWLALVAAGTAWFAVAALTQLWPDRPEGDWPYTDSFAVILGSLGAGVVVAAAAVRWLGSLRRLQRLAPWLVTLAVFVFIWELVTAKLGLLLMSSVAKQRAMPQAAQSFALTGAAVHDARSLGRSPVSTRSGGQSDTHVLPSSIDSRRMRNRLFSRGIC
jgi:hypothetical protein